MGFVKPTLIIHRHRTDSGKTSRHLLDLRRRTRLRDPCLLVALRAVSVNGHSLQCYSRNQLEKLGFQSFRDRARVLLNLLHLLGQTSHSDSTIASEKMMSVTVNSVDNTSADFMVCVDPVLPVECQSGWGEQLKINAWVLCKITSLDHRGESL